VGINVWRALRTNNSIHPAWLHLASTPLSEADLPRAIEPTEGPAAAAGAPAAAAAANAKGGAAAKVGVDGTPVVAVKAFEPVAAETDEELADRAH
jgi:hypothetical protein